MTGLGTAVNCAAILLGCAVGLVFKKGFPEKWRETITYGMALSIFLIGIQMAQKSQNLILIIISIVIGSMVGEALDLDGKLNRFGHWMEKKILGDPVGTATTFGQGFITATLLYCIGAMAIVGSLEDGLNDNYQILYTKAILDGIFSVILSATMGAGVALSALPVGLYQGGMTFLALWLQNLLTPDIIAEVSATGGILIMSIGAVQARVVSIRLANQLPALPAVAILAKLFL